MLKVEPRTDGKFLYRGRIWVDGHDFAVVRLEAEPRKNRFLLDQEHGNCAAVYEGGEISGFRHDTTALRPFGWEAMPN